ncbi:MAG: hypothetical protein HN337_08550, partial [Deltaproteobacteria bacterium]|nr:hypothetical protein [Deltaproteobacteria bacterium]
PSKTFDAETLATELNLHASEYVDCSTGTLMSVDPTLVQQFHPEACFDPIELGIVYDPLFEECRAEYEGGISQSMSDYLPTTTDPATVTTMWDKMISPWKLDQLNFREGYLFGAVKDFVSVASKKIPDFTVTPTSVSDEPGTSKGAQIALLKETKAELESNIISATVAKAGQSAEEQIASGDPATGMVAEVASWRTKLAETVAQIATLEKKGSPDDQANAMLLHVNAMMHCFQDTAHDLGAPWRKLSEGKNMSAAMIVQCLAPSLTAKGDALSFKAIDLSMAAYAQGDPIKVSFGNLVRAMKMYTDTVTLRGLHNVQLRMLPPAVQKELATKMKSIFDRLKAGKLTEAKAKTEMDALFSKDELKPLRATAVKIEEKLIESQSFLKQVNPDNLDVAGFQLYQDFVGLLQDEVKRSAQALMMAQVKETPVAADPVKPVTT